MILSKRRTYRATSMYNYPVRFAKVDIKNIYRLVKWAIALSRKHYIHLWNFVSEVLMLLQHKALKLFFLFILCLDATSLSDQRASCDQNSENCDRALDLDLYVCIASLRFSCLVLYDT
ncbi:hypothetical protein ACJX0J_030597, partial [Zea mays]